MKIKSDVFLCCLTRTIKARNRQFSGNSFKFEQLFSNHGCVTVMDIFKQLLNNQLTKWLFIYLRSIRSQMFQVLTFLKYDDNKHDKITFCKMVLRIRFRNILVLRSVEEGSDSTIYVPIKKSILSQIESVLDLNFCCGTLISYNILRSRQVTLDRE